ncbi:hypothetical protein JTB14_018473 [Gonioctena quinquepunctata]|nr:hypothetical protein JTB14_018473 [Gonioctena quinquepunctata]
MLHESDLETLTEQDLSKRSAGNVPQKDVECAIMYKNHEPVGILQPFKDAYKLLPVGRKTADMNAQPRKEETVVDILHPRDLIVDYDNNIEFSDERYPSVLASFKIDSGLDGSMNPNDDAERSIIKRESDKLSDNEFDNVEVELANILDDMNLVDDYPNQNAKREAEDEYSELDGDIMDSAEEYSENRGKREDDLPSVGNTDIISGPAKSAQTNDCNEKEKPGNSQITELENQDKLNYVEGEPREKRTEENDKSEETRNQMSSMGYVTNNIGAVTDIDDHEKRVERGIRDKIHKLKEAVLKEIKALKGKSKSNKTKTSAKYIQRKKRQIVNPTLLDAENSNIDPNLNVEEGEKNHIRRKRSMEHDDFEMHE